MEKTVLINCSPKKKLSVSGFIMRCAALMIRAPARKSPLDFCRCSVTLCAESRAQQLTHDPPSG